LTHHPASLGGCFAIFIGFARSAPPGQQGQVPRLRVWGAAPL